MVKFAPKAQLTAIIDNWDSYYVARAKAVLDGTWTSADTWGGIDTGMVEMAEFNDAIPADVAKQAQAAADAIKAGALHPFTGPIKDQAGEVVVADGVVMDDGALLGMDWYVEGVAGPVAEIARQPLCGRTPSRSAGMGVFSSIPGLAGPS